MRQSSRRVIVLAGGGHAKVVIDTLRLLGYDIIGLTDPRLPVGEPGPLATPVLGDDETIRNHDPAAIELANGIGSLPRSGERRRDCFCEWRDRGYDFVTLVHPRAWVSEHARLREGAQVMAGACVQAEARIGHNTILNTGCSIDHDCAIGDHVHIGPGATLSGQVTVGDGVHVGTGAAIIQGVSVGAGAVIGAGAVVVQDVARGTWILPARCREEPARTRAEPS